MKTPRLGRSALGCVAVALFAACGGSQPPIGAPGAMPQTSVIAAHAPFDSAQGDEGTSWMAADASKKDLLYVTNGEVDVYSYPRGGIEGQLTGFSYPYGTCTDKQGNVYIIDYTADAAVEYAHGGTKPIRTLSVPGTGPVGCAVDRTSGDLAVTTAGTTYGIGANVVIYRKAKGTPKTYTDPAILNYSYCAYDNAGDLFVDGTPAHGYGYDFELAELTRGGTSFGAVVLAGGVSWAGALQWDGHDLVVGQPVRPEIQRYTISAGYGTLDGSTMLTSAYDALQFIIAGDKTVVTNEYFVGYIFKWDVLVFNYPAGGSETQEIMGSGQSVNSVALSRSRK